MHFQADSGICTPDTRTFFEISRKMPPPLGGLPFQLFTTTNYGMSAYGTVPAARSFTFAATNTRERWDDVECLAHLALFVWNAFPSSLGSCVRFVQHGPMVRLEQRHPENQRKLQGSQGSQGSHFSCANVPSLPARNLPVPRHFDPIGDLEPLEPRPPCPMSPMITELKFCFCISSLSMSDCQIMIHFVDVCGLSANSGVHHLLWVIQSFRIQFWIPIFMALSSRIFSARLDRSAGHFLTNLKACGRDPDSI